MEMTARLTEKDRTLVAALHGAASSARAPSPRYTFLHPKQTVPHPVPGLMSVRVELVHTGGPSGHVVSS